MANSNKHSVTVTATTTDSGGGKELLAREVERKGGVLQKREQEERREVREGAEGREEERGEGEEETGEEEEERGNAEEDARMARAYSRWLEKPASLSVPLRVVALRGTVPSMWRKDFLVSQSPLAKLALDVRPSHAAIANDLLAPLASQPPASSQPAAPTPSAKRKKKPPPPPSLRSAAAADIVTVGDRWIKALIAQGALLPLDGVERSDWFRALGPTWLRLLDRTPSGDLALLSPLQTASSSSSSSGEGEEALLRGKVYAVPYRMGYLAVAWRADKLKQQGIKPIQTWSDLWQPALRGQVAVIDSPRELLAVTMRSLGAPFNPSSPLDAHVPGGMAALKGRWHALMRQVRVCDSSNYLKAFQASDVLVVVGWSSDLLPFARRNSNITVAAPADGTLLFADLWAVPATARYNIPKAAWRNRGPSPLIGQWMKFCLQPARAVPLQREIFSAFSPTLLPSSHPLLAMDPADKASTKAHSTTTSTTTSPSSTTGPSSTTSPSSTSSSDGSGLPAPAILAVSEFLEPLDGRAQEELNVVLQGGERGEGGQGKQGRVRQALEAVGSALGVARRRE
ncbi:hypothetical protein CLOM_g883 [Closterium sp. NIES-68]|nr:hypothetical protein CLOM_g883 [Closterium sp. NIES-68]GJP65936.1 hypothetical protein CLOP_g22832 [Closterium sp. NIES-67]